MQDNQVVNVTSRHHHDVTEGNLCILRPRFGYQFVQEPLRLRG